MSGRDAAIADLRRRRPRDRFLRISLAALAALLAASWTLGGFAVRDAFSPRRIENLRRFLAEVRPYPLQGREFDVGEAIDYYRALWDDKIGAAAADTLAISVLAIVLAAALSLPLALLAARNVCRPDPFGVAARRPPLAARAAWSAVTTAARAALTLLRCLPEYVLAFLLLAMLGPTPWSVVLALALHNAGILGRLTGEVIENVDPAAPRALRAQGASRAQLALLALPPLLLTRFLLFFFYRWETCVREATVLGMLGVLSLGYWIADYRSRGQTDGFAFAVAVGAAIVVAGDLVSAGVRRAVRRS